tara:strand:+ start:1702 stop:2613 length:912 start_codon:yes stop_codon:yes gene_type:complete
MPGVVITQWTGAVDGDYSDNANWTNNVPTTNGTADVYFTTGSVDCNENLPVTADDVDYKQLTIGPKYTGTIGSSTVPLEIDDVVDVFYAQKTGQVFLHADIQLKLIVESTSTSNPSLALVADAGSNNSTVTGNIYVTGGNGTVLFEQVTWTGELYMVDCKGVTVEMAAAGTIANGSFFVGDGRLVLHEIPVLDSDITITDGLVEVLNNGTSLDSLTLYGGTFKWKNTPSSSNNIITTLTMYGGFFDARGATAASMTITNATIYKGAIIDERNGLSNITYSNAIVTHGGVVMCDPFRTITVTSP